MKANSTMSFSQKQIKRRRCEFYENNFYNTCRAMKKEIRQLRQ